MSAMSEWSKLVQTSISNYIKGEGDRPGKYRSIIDHYKKVREFEQGFVPAFVSTGMTTLSFPEVVEKMDVVSNDLVIHCVGGKTYRLINGAELVRQGQVSVPVPVAEESDKAGEAEPLPDSCLLVDLREHKDPCAP